MVSRLAFGPRIGLKAARPARPGECAKRPSSQLEIFRAGWRCDAGA